MLFIRYPCLHNVDSISSRLLACVLRLTQEQGSLQICAINKQRKGCKDLQTKDRVATGVSNFGKGDKTPRVQLIALVHVYTPEGRFDIRHCRDAVERPDGGRLGHSS